MANATYEVHHSAGLWELRLCDGSRYGKTLNHYLEKKVKVCAECGHWDRRCELGYITNKTMPACKQALSVIEMVRRHL